MKTTPTPEEIEAARTPAGDWPPVLSLALGRIADDTDLLGDVFGNTAFPSVK
jgi:hypothetical protein